MMPEVKWAWRIIAVCLTISAINLTLVISLWCWRLWKAMSW